VSGRRVGSWLEVGERVFSRRYEFFDQQIGAILTADGPVVVDTRTTARQAREIVDDLRALTAQPVAGVVDSHHHFDHAFGNGIFRPAPIWGHQRCASRLRRDGAARRQAAIVELPELADDLRATEIVPPDQTFDDALTVEIGGRTIELRYEGRGHTDDDIVVLVPDAEVLFAGDLVESGAPPNFADGYPLDWPSTLARIRPLVRGTVVPGHGDVADAAFVDRTIAELGAIAELVRRIGADDLGLDAAIAVAPYPASAAKEALERGLAQLRGHLDRATP
jgi:glyoxylase-like metal-dependent hydrolase (beta-lactamase superfamily II)